MLKFWRLMGEYDAETATWSALAGGGGSSPYTPDFNGKLVALRVVVSREAATSLTNHVEFRLTSAQWSPSTIECGGEGTGLQTAPAFFGGFQDWVVDAAIKAGIPITIEGRCPGAETSVTNEVYLYGLFLA
jgi:hypothetical protein